MVAMGTVVAGVGHRSASSLRARALPSGLAVASILSFSSWCWGLWSAPSGDFSTGTTTITMITDNIFSESWSLLKLQVHYDKINTCLFPGIELEQ
jgi:hypothetical protein